MTRRMLDSAIWQNEKFGVMPSMARLLAIGIINQADDQGRGKAHPVYLRSQLFPYDDVTPGEVAEWLRAVAGNETILLYQVDGKDYYQILNWWTYQAHQYAMPSQYPKPDGWQDRIRRTLTKGVIVTCNWITADGKRSPDTCNEQGLAIQVINQVNEQVNAPSTNQVNIQDSDKDKDKDYVEDKVPKGSAEAGAPTAPVMVSRSYQEWCDLLRDNPNKAAAAIDMFKSLYPSAVDVPGFGRIGATAKKLGGWGRLAELLWQHSAKPPSGDVLSYIEVAAKSNGKARLSNAPEPMPTDYEGLKAKYVPAGWEGIIEH